MIKHNGCGECGEYTGTVPARLANGKLAFCDPCIYDLVQALNNAGVLTVASCCGHGRQPASIVLDDGRELTIDLNEEWAARKAMR